MNFAGEGKRGLISGLASAGGGRGGINSRTKGGEEGATKPAAAEGAVDANGRGHGAILIGPAGGGARERGSGRGRRRWEKHGEKRKEKHK
jgi:hypothetical protein